MTKKQEKAAKLLYDKLHCLRLEVDSSIVDDIIYTANDLFPISFQMPTDEQMIKLALLFNDGFIDDKQRISDMVAYAQFIINRLYENGTILKKSSKEDY